MAGKSVIVFAPHPDDETLACGGTIVKKIQRGYTVYIVVMTDGRHSHDLVLKFEKPSPGTLTKIRKKELTDATKILEVRSRNLIFLGFEDSKLEQFLAKASKRIVQILRKIRPVEVYVPYRNDNLDDHRATYKIVRDSIRKVSLRAKMFEYPMWGREAPRRGFKIVTTDISRELKRKVEAISKYQSQISKCFPSQERVVLDEDFVKMCTSAREVFYVE